jgi:hypothetical protein
VQALGLVALACFFVSTFFAGVVRGQKKKPAPLTAVCGCSHIFSAHKDGGKCQATIYRNYTDHYCACTIYVGPDPMALGLWMPTKPIK